MVKIFKDIRKDGKTSRTENKIRESLFKIKVVEIKTII